MTPRIVADASVLLKWFLPDVDEPHADMADRMRIAHVDGWLDLCVPALAPFEIGNTLARLKPPELARADLDDLALLDLHVEPMTSARIALAVDLVSRFGVTYYDASYHALAIDMNTRLVSADGRYLQRVASVDHAQHLSEWKP